MAGAKKRASMREGPLAALFRRTEEEGTIEDQSPPTPRQRAEALLEFAFGAGKVSCPRPTGATGRQN